MGLAVGSELGPYVVLAPLGSGGMGEVYRARDSRLGREVALKVINEEKSQDPELLLRLQQEARAASSLNHPNVVVVHDIGEVQLPAPAGTVRYLVMELLAGQALMDLIADGPLTLRTFLDLAAQLADGLAAAHEAGLVHRDLKPSNIFVSPDGHVKILDFGLAKIVRPHGDASSALTADSPTTPGEILGTVGYMSPEQVRGEPATPASDQFSLGCVLYQMLTGRRPFQRSTKAEMLSAILRDDPPPIAQVNAAVPAPVCWIVERCLAKSPQVRYASTRDLARELATLREHVVELSSSVFPHGGSPRSSYGRTRPRAAVALATASAAVGAVVLVGLFTRRSTPSEPPTYRRLTWQRGTIESARFGPDGQTVVYSASWDGRLPAVYVKRPDSQDSVALDLPSAVPLAISPSGEMILQLRRRGAPFGNKRGVLARAPLTGGTPREILEDVTFADAGPDGKLLVAHVAAGKARLEYPPGTVVYATAGEVSFPRLSPKGDLVAFVDHPLADEDRGAIAVLDHGGKRTLSKEFESVQGLAWSPSGDEIWFTAEAAGESRSLRGVALDGRQRVIARVPGEIRLQDVARSGRLLLTRGEMRAAIRWLAPGDTREREISWFGQSVLADLAADGRSIVFEEEGGPMGPNYAVCFLRRDGTPVLLGEGNAGPLSPDGTWVLSQVPKPGAPFVLLPTGPGEPKPISLAGLSARLTGSVWLPDGRRILVTGQETARPGGRIFLLGVDGGAPRPLTDETEGKALAVSPRGDVVAGIGTDRKLRLYPVGGGESRQVPGAVEGDIPVQWSADGRSLYILNGPELYSPARVHLLDLKTGVRTFWKEFYPEDPAGVRAIGGVRVTRDGRAYAYSYTRLLSDLYLEEGLK